VRKTIGLVGFFGWGNYGDELFLRVWREHLSDDFKLKVVHDRLKKPYFSRPVSKVIGDLDAILIGGGDLVIPWRVSDLYWRDEYLQRPVYIAGIGVPTWGKPDHSVIERLRRFFQHPSVQYISARDPESAGWIEHNLDPRVRVGWAPDLVFGLSLPEVARDTQRKILSIATRYRPHGPDDLTQMALLAEKAIDMGWQVRNLVLATGQTRRLDVEVARQLQVRDVEIVESDDLDRLSQAIGSSDAMASMKFHGTVVATAYGVPCIAIAGTDKSRNLLRLIDRIPMQASLTDPTLPDRLSPYILPVPRIVSEHLRRLTLNQITTLRSAILAGPTNESSDGAEKRMPQEVPTIARSAWRRWVRTRAGLAGMPIPAQDSSNEVSSQEKR
jgi:polysaccharide pyruvyl transferase WcaK-like protein